MDVGLLPRSTASCAARRAPRGAAVTRRNKAIVCRDRPGDPTVDVSAGTSSRAFPKFESYGMLEMAASVGWKVKDAIVWFHGIGRLV
jgi:hypothetical protein